MSCGVISILMILICTSVYHLIPRNKLKLNTDKTKVLLVGFNLVPGSGSMLILETVALIPKLSVRSLGLLLDADLLLDGEVAAVASGSYHQLRQVHQLHPFFDKRDLMNTCTGPIQAGLLSCGLCGDALERASKNATSTECHSYKYTIGKPIFHHATPFCRSCTSFQ